MHGPYELFDLGDLLLEENYTLRECKLAYTTFAELNEAKDNVILVTFGRQPSPTGELLLRQPGDLAQPPDPPPKRDILSENNVSSFAFRHVVGILVAVTSGNTGALIKGTLRAFPQCKVD